MVLSRRKLLASTSVVPLSGFISRNSSAQQKRKWPGFIDTDEIHTVSFIDQYYENMMAIIRGIRDTQIDNIAAAMEKAYECYRDGGTIYGSHDRFTHSPKYELFRQRPGQPGLIPAMRPNRKNFERLKKGDFVLAWSNSTDKSELDARDRGVYFAGITNPFYKFSRTPDGTLAQDQLAVEEYSDIVIDSQTTYETGLVKSPKLHFRFGPGGAKAVFLVYWACTASLAHLIATNGKGSSSEPAKRYLDMAVERGEMLGTDRPKVIYETEKWADYVLDRKGRIIVFGHQMKGANPDQNVENVFCDESTGAGSCQMVVPYSSVIKNPERDLRPTDIVLIGGISSDHPDEIQVARTARSMGARTVAFCPYQTEGDRPDNRLFREAEVAFNTYSYERAGVFEAAGFKENVSPLTWITGSFINFMLVTQFADHMALRGELPYFRWPWVYVGASDYNRNIVVPNARERGY
jgi:uncharacterized phosphosugar-binding protein